MLFYKTFAVKMLAILLKSGLTRNGYMEAGKLGGGKAESWKVSFMLCGSACLEDISYRTVCENLFPQLLYP
ncbi:MAG: hypothetical protein DRG59_13205 [Deltaproteobacteria bacterium]|nr:MAG: hypothetical protein DRG59_13205 [Deltaproteobacteria bacterium]